MKKYTALFMAVFMIVGIVGGGVVYFSVPVYATEEYTVLYETEEILIKGLSIYYYQNGGTLGTLGYRTYLINPGYSGFLYLSQKYKNPLYYSFSSGVLGSCVRTSDITQVLYQYNGVYKVYSYTLSNKEIVNFNFYCDTGYGMTNDAVNNPNPVVDAQNLSGGTDNIDEYYNYLINNEIVIIIDKTANPDPDPNPDPNPGPAPIVGGTTFVLKPGYACDIFYGGESYEVTARRIGQNRSSLFQINGSWWPYDNVLIANGVTTPITQNMDIYSSSEFGKIPWQKEPPYNLFGITYNSYYHVSGYDGHTVIANPVHYYGAGDGYNIPIQEQQTPIKITVSDEESQLTVYCWSLADSIDNNVITSTTVTRYTLGNDGMWYTDNDEMAVLEIGGETEVVNNQQATLDDLVSNIKTFFEGTWRHVRQLVTSAGKLPSVVVELYSWLPEEYKAVLFSAFGIVIVVGILKVML